MRCRWLERCWTAVVLVLVVIVAIPAHADDRHAGYYYPETVTHETYPGRAQVLSDSDASRRIGFVVEITQQMMQRPYPPRFAMFAKGADAEKMLIVALQDGFIDTLPRARALLAMLTSVARATPLFNDIGEIGDLTFFDLLQILGFSQITISDGESYAHQVKIE